MYLFSTGRLVYFLEKDRYCYRGFLQPTKNLTIHSETRPMTMYTYVYIETNLVKPFQNFTGCARLLADSITVSEVNYIYELTFCISPKKTNVLS